MSPAKGKGGHIGFSADPVCAGVSVPFLVAEIYLEPISPNLHGYISRTSLRAHFQNQKRTKRCEIFTKIFLKMNQTSLGSMYGNLPGLHGYIIMADITLTGQRVQFL